MTVAELLDRSAVEAVVHVTGAEVLSEARVLTRDFVRPPWSGGRLVLHCRPGAGGVLVPFEVPDPTPCCAGHA